MRVLCVVAQRNEVACLEPWVRYHSYLVGMENIHIIDNASDIPSVVDMVSRYESLGIGVTRIAPGTDFSTRGRYVSNVIHHLEDREDYDFVFPMDCDEFLCVEGVDEKPSCDRLEIFEYLASLAKHKGVFEIFGGLENINGLPGRFVFRDHYIKVFFSQKECLNVDIGFHRGYPRSGEPAVKTRIFYLHMQVRPYGMYKHLARQKLEPFVDVANDEAVRNHKGANHHLVHLFCLPEDGYNAALEEKRLRENLPEREFRNFVNLFSVLGLSIDFLNENEYWRLGGEES